MAYNKSEEDSLQMNRKRVWYTGFSRKAMSAGGRRLRKHAKTAPPRAFAWDAANRYLLRCCAVADYLRQQPPTEIGEPTVKMLERTFEVRGPDGLGAKPRPELIGPDFSSLIRLRPGEESAFRRILGSIPAEESDEVFVAAVEAFSCMANQSDDPSPDPA